MDYVLPLKATETADLTELAGYLHRLTHTVRIIVVDGSEAAVFERNRALFGAEIMHVAPAPDLQCSNGKVSGVRTGFRLCASDTVVVADDDVRYEPEQLQRLAVELETADVIRPQNYFGPLPWHARWDTARTLLNRAVGADFPGTLAVRLTPALRVDGYHGDVLFENLELIRTVRAAGGREQVLADLYVRRLPPDAGHFWHQRLRQAYDSLAQPARLVAELCVLPGLAALALQRGYKTLLTTAVALVGLAERGRRKAGGVEYFPTSSALWVLPWVLERGCCVWAAVGLRVSGRGVGYAGGRIVSAANSTRRLRRLRAACAAPLPAG